MQTLLKPIFFDDILVGETMTHEGLTLFFSTSALPPFGYEKIFPDLRFRFLRQEHSSRVRKVPLTAGVSYRPVGDSLITEQANTAVSIYSSDCLPIFLHFRSDCGFSIAAIHAGWRGLASGIIPKTLEQLCVIGDGGRCFAYIGPHIRWDNYPIQSDVADCLLASAHDAGALLRCRPGCSKIYADLSAVAAAQLTSNGIDADDLYVHPACTFGDLRYASYRRDSDSKKRNVSFCAIGAVQR